MCCPSGGVGSTPTIRASAGRQRYTRYARRVEGPAYLVRGSMAKEWAQGFYKSQAWKALRQRALIRDGFTCRFCGARATEVDHIRELTPENIGDRQVSLNINNLQSLCHVCHTIKTMEDKGVIQKDCDEKYFFDENGDLSPRVVNS